MWFVDVHQFVLSSSSRIVHQCDPKVDDRLSGLIEKNHPFYFISWSPELKKNVGFCFSIVWIFHFHPSCYAEIEMYVAAPSTTSGSTPATVSPSPSKSAATRSPVSAATLVLAAMAAPLLSYYYLWRSAAWFVPWITVICVGIAPRFSDYFVERTYCASCSV